MFFNRLLRTWQQKGAVESPNELKSPVREDLEGADDLDPPTLKVLHDLSSNAQPECLREMGNVIP